MEDNTNKTEVQQDEVVETQNKTYTQEEVDKLLQAETDRRVTQALKKAETKNAAKVKEAEKLARMNADEKLQYELEQREKAIELKEKELAMAENKNAAAKILSEKGISLNLVDFVVDSDADVMDSRIKLLDNEFKKCVKAEVEKRLVSKSPKASLGMEHVNEKDFRRMSAGERGKYLADLKEQDPDAFNEIKAQLYK